MGKLAGQSSRILRTAVVGRSRTTTEDDRLHLTAARCSEDREMQSFRYGAVGRMACESCSAREDNLVHATAMRPQAARHSTPGRDIVAVFRVAHAGLWTMNP